MKRAAFYIARLKNENGAPEWILLFKAGWNELEGEISYLVDELSFEMVRGDFERRGNDIVFDYEHQTLTGQEAPAAGWIKELKWEDGKGIWARVEWTEKAAARIVKKEYRYFSPVFYVRPSDKRLVALDSVALTNQPKHNHLTPIMAKLTSKTEVEDMDKLLQKIAAKLGIEDPTEDKVIEVIASLQNKEPEPKEVLPKELLEALEMEEGDVSAVVASVHALKQAKTAMVSREEFEKLQAKLIQREAEEVVAKALSGGKITTAQKEWAMEYAKRDMEGFKTFVAKAPVVVPVGKLPGKQEQADEAENLDETILQVAKMMDVPEEDLKKYGGIE